MPSLANLVALVAALTIRPAHSVLGKSTYAMSHPFAYKAWMEKFLPTKENIVQKNSTKTCNEWVKLCVDDGSTPFECSGPMGNTQIHSVGAYLRDPGAMSMQAIELQFTQTLAGMKSYDPMMELHAAFHTTDLDTYVSKFKAAAVPYLATTFESGGKSYNSILVHVDGSLAAGAKSLLVLELVGTSSLAALQWEAVNFTTPRASARSLRRATALSATGLSSTALKLLHVSFPSSNVTRDADYFENVLDGTKVAMTTAKGTTTYSGILFDGDTVEVRYTQSAQVSRGAMSVEQWENYVTKLHAKCIPSPNPHNQGFDRLADNHIGGHGPHSGGGSGPGTVLGPYIERQKTAGLPYRIYGGPGGGDGPHFLYLYGPNGWGYQITGKCEDASLCPGSNVVGYDMCTQGIKGHCNVDG